MGRNSEAKAIGRGRIKHPPSWYFTTTTSQGEIGCSWFATDCCCVNMLIDSGEMYLQLFKPPALTLFHLLFSDRWYNRRRSETSTQQVPHILLWHSWDVSSVHSGAGGWEASFLWKLATLQFKVMFGSLFSPTSPQGFLGTQGLVPLWEIQGQIREAQQKERLQRRIVGNPEQPSCQLQCTTGEQYENAVVHQGQSWAE